MIQSMFTMFLFLLPQHQTLQHHVPLQQPNTPIGIPIFHCSFKLNTKHSIPKFNRVKNMDNLDSQLHNMEDHFKIQCKCIDAKKHLIVKVHMDEQALTQIQMHTYHFLSTNQPLMGTWDKFKASQTYLMVLSQTVIRRTEPRPVLGLPRLEMACLGLLGMICFLLLGAWIDLRHVISLCICVLIFVGCQICVLILANCQIYVMTLVTGARGATRLF